MHNKQKFIIFALSKKINRNIMPQYVSKERRKLEKELLFYLRKYRFYKSRFTYKDDLDWIINQIVEELKSDV